MTTAADDDSPWKEALEDEAARMLAEVQPVTDLAGLEAIGDRLETASSLDELRQLYNWPVAD